MKNLTIPQALQPYREKIIQTVKPAINITLTPADDIPIWQSKVGGRPYLPWMAQYPHNSKGEPLFLLAQINCAELPKNDSLPAQGMLSFFIGGNDLYGMDFDDLQKQDGFRVLYFDTVTHDVTQLWQDFSEIDGKIGAEFEDYYLPIPRNQTFAMTFEMGEMPVTTSDFGFNQLFDGQDFWTDIVKNDDVLADEVYDSDTFSGLGHRLLGYPHFTQYDPREGNAELEDCILLLQIDSEWAQDKDIMWGDMGVGNFFIHPSDLKNRDFSKVMYSWDCG